MVVKYTEGMASEKEIYSNLISCNQSFIPPLEKKINIHKYSKERGLINHALIFILLLRADYILHTYLPYLRISYIYQEYNQLEAEGLINHARANRNRKEAVCKRQIFKIPWNCIGRIDG